MLCTLQPVEAGVRRGGGGCRRCACVHLRLHPLGCTARPEAWVTPVRFPYSPSPLPLTPTTHLTPPASKCSHRLILRLWLHTGRPRSLFLRQHAPDSAPFCSPSSPPLPCSPVFASSPSRHGSHDFQERSCNLPFIVINPLGARGSPQQAPPRWLSGLSGVLEGKPGASLISPQDQNRAWSNWRICILLKMTEWVNMVLGLSCEQGGVARHVLSTNAECSNNGIQIKTNFSFLEYQVWSWSVC